MPKARALVKRRKAIRNLRKITHTMNLIDGATVAVAGNSNTTLSELATGRIIVLLKYTYGGDANLDGTLDIDDYIKIYAGIGAGVRGWSNGDFNYDGKIDIDDDVIIDGNLPNQGPPLTNASSLYTVAVGTTISWRLSSRAPQSA